MTPISEQHTDLLYLCRHRDETLNMALSKFYYQLMYKRIALKGVLKSTLKQLQHVSV
jgi:hypothetical protein